MIDFSRGKRIARAFMNQPIKTFKRAARRIR